MCFKKLIIVAIDKTKSILIVVEKLCVIPVVDVGTGGDEMTARQCLVKRRIIPPTNTYFIGHSYQFKFYLSYSVKFLTRWSNAGIWYWPCLEIPALANLFL